VPACDGQTDGRTDGFPTIAITGLPVTLTPCKNLENLYSPEKKTGSNKTERRQSVHSNAKVPMQITTIFIPQDNY